MIPPSYYKPPSTTIVLLPLVAQFFLGIVSQVLAGENKWTKLKTKVSSDTLEILVVDPTQPEVLYAFANQKGFLRSRDSGIQWEMKSHVLPRRNIQKIVVDAFRSRTIYACTDSGLFLSNSMGDEWKFLGFPDTTVNTVVAAQHSSDTLYAAIGNEFYETQNGGDTWRRAPHPATLIKTTIRAIAISPNDPNQLYVGTDGGIYKFEREQGVFKQRKGPEFSEQKTIDLIVDPLHTKVVFALFEGPQTNAGVHWAEDGFWDWGKMNFGLNPDIDLPLRSLSLNPNRPKTLYASNHQNNIFSFDFAFPDIGVLDFNPLAIPPWEVARLSQSLVDQLRRTHSVLWLGRQEMKEIENQDLSPESKEMALKFGKMFGFEYVVSGQVHILHPDSADQIRIVPRVTHIAQGTQYFHEYKSAFKVHRYDYGEKDIDTVVNWIYEKMGYDSPIVRDTVIAKKRPSPKIKIWLGVLGCLGLGYALHTLIASDEGKRSSPSAPVFP